ncbi:head GIN domain-containing protein [Paremcibacter congregatus]|uniref:Putative auto-transporter adhesin head GIN domain-containing protein n=1 Tax=Paremcibacter congregatus TaxID=2043170 RepID=A0A2G4YRN4_9PROT|nr:head GIN domain-containing protein [Paremcibacter congregatus]PHZ84968.1 hypothetical protein CRD36_09610 [Paremcibacter congregatus]QDE26057.1 DUF2807 domain-containing protein [Paremcibacter congregatus]
MTILPKISMIALASMVLSPVAFAAEKDMKLDTFSKIKIYAPVDLDVSVGKNQKFSLTGDADDLEKIIVLVKGDTLYIKKKKHSGRIGEMKATVNLKELTTFVVNGSSDAKIRDVDSTSFELQINGSGDVTFNGKSDALDIQINGSGDVSTSRFDAESVSAEINGSGDIKLVGDCKTLQMSISGSGDFSARDLTCATVHSRISGSGDAMLYASESIQVSTSGSSDVDVYGNPKSIKNRSSGSSDFIVHDEK